MSVYLRSSNGGKTMLLRLFAAVSASATALNIVLRGPKANAARTAGFALLRFIEYYFAAGLTYLAGMYAFTELAVDLDEPQESPSEFWQKQFGDIAEMVRDAMNVKVVLSGTEKLPTDGRYLIVSNHRSLFDPVTMAATFRNERYVYISKPSNFKIPIAGKVMHKCGCMPLNRENNREALITIKRAAELIKNDTASIVIYPEGTRTQENELKPFHAGSFKIAQKSGVPVVLIAMRNTDKVIHNAPFKRTTVYIDIVDVIDAGYVKTHTTKEIAELAQRKIQERLNIENQE